MRPNILCWAGILGLLCVSVAQADKLYATRGGNASGIARMNLDGTGVENLISTGSEEIRGIAMDLTRGKMYYTQAITGGNNNKVRRANFDGSGAEDIILCGNGITPNHIAVNGDKVYWTEGGGSGNLKRANLDGTDVETIATGSFDGIAVATCLQKIYWLTESGTTTMVRRSNLDGTSPETMVSVANELTGFGLSISTLGKVYWFGFALSGPNPLHSANLDGTGLNVITTTSQVIMGTVVDENAGKIYWTLIGTPEKIQRANLDGSGIQDVSPAPANGPYLALGLDFEGPLTCPTVSTWGAACLGLLVLSAGTLVLRRHKGDAHG